MKLIEISLVIASCIATLSALLPEYILVCKANDPQIATCINNSINHLRPRFESGIDELEVPPLEPLKLNEIKLRRGPAAAALECNITNLKVWGPSRFIISELKPDLQKNVFIFKIWLPHLYFTGEYSLNMNIVLLTVHGKGPIEGNFTNYGSEVIMKGKKIVRNDEEYLKFDKIRLRLNIGKSKILLGNLFNSDPILRQVAENLVNDNSDLFIHEIQPTLEYGLAEKFTEIANKITLRFTYKELFL